MPDRVIDASSLAAVVFEEPDGASVLENCRGSRLLAPGLVDYEMVNICLMKRRRYPDVAEKLAIQFDAYQRLDIKRCVVDIGGVLALAEKTRLTAYDASYLWLAIKNGCPLSTLDKALDAAWRQTITTRTN
ncbi:MAG: type II toxin-antitoxin system VapC family toxin [Sulfurimicrobium sp.]|jgi:predicted nucleic acid-binding protein|nr:type II toxin-antitoxin system VapC family toxin [Sulfurimicrobium sp.]MDZ7655660.1 type II toxin-antitoxin system VapC family toxin [Sulfurimicrobium sp.]